VRTFMCFSEACTHKCTYTPVMRVHINAHDACTHTCTYTLGTPSRTRKHSHRDIETCAHAQTHRQTAPRAHTHTHTHTPPHTHTYIPGQGAHQHQRISSQQPHGLSLTHTHTHSLSLALSVCLSCLSLSLSCVWVCAKISCATWYSYIHTCDM
jgi:hypothetical protein